ncbi:hypothetical protein G9P44_002942 [Scheffersomyces stipitis]|nr:hypothetical protein G9P44_002942 [Scheffersomyces stipitis]
MNSSTTSSEFKEQESRHSEQGHDHNINDDSFEITEIYDPSSNINMSNGADDNKICIINSNDNERNGINTVDIGEKSKYTIAKNELLVNPDVSIKQILKHHPVQSFARCRWLLYTICAGLYLCSTMNGYDGSLQTAIETLPAYRTYFNLSNSASDTGLVFSIFPAGAICATIFIWLGDYIGRVLTIIIGLVGTIVGSIVVSSTHNHSAYIGGRFLLSFFSTIANCTAAILLTESVPYDMRWLVGCFNTFYYIGSIIATWTMYGTSKNFEGPQTFKIGLWLQILCPGMALVLICSSALLGFGDSPRYYYGKNKIETARDFIIKYHANGDVSHPIVAAEMEELELSFRTNGFLKPKDYLNYSNFFRTTSNRKRTALVVAWSWFNQFSGNQVITYYMTTLFLTLGIKNATTRLLLTGINSILCYIFATCGGLLIDRLPRRWVLLYANAGFVICFAGLAAAVRAFQADANNHTAASAGIAFMYLFMTIFFSFAFTPLQPIYPAEVMSNDMRGRGMALYFFISNVASFVNLYSAPVAMQNIKYWYYVFFVFWDAFQFAIIYFFFVETCALTLEEIEVVFKEKHTVKESIKLSKMARSHIHRSWRRNEADEIETEKVNTDNE